MLKRQLFEKMSALAGVFGRLWNMDVVYRLPRFSYSSTPVNVDTG